MRQRRNKRTSKDIFLEDLQIFSKILFVLIIFSIIIFIYSAIKVKNNSLKLNTNNNMLEISKEEPVTEKEEPNDNIDNAEISTSKKEEGPKNTTINMAFTGDIMCHNTIYNDAYNSSTRRI